MSQKPPYLFCLSYDAKDSKAYNEDPNIVRKAIISMLLGNGVDETTIISLVASTILFKSDTFQVINWASQLKDLQPAINFVVVRVDGYKQDGKYHPTIKAMYELSDPKLSSNFRLLVNEVVSGLK